MVSVRKGSPAARHKKESSSHAQRALQPRPRRDRRPPSHIRTHTSHMCMSTSVNRARVHSSGPWCRGGMLRGRTWLRGVCRTFPCGACEHIF